MSDEFKCLVYGKFTRDNSVTEVGSRSDVANDYPYQRRIFQNFTLAGTNGSTQEELIITPLTTLDELWLANLDTVKTVEVSVKSGGSYYPFATLKPGDAPIRISCKTTVDIWLMSSVAGTMASATSTSAAFTVGQTVIPLATAGTGVVAAGDNITFANDLAVYRVASVSFAGANPASGDTITLASPGLLLAQGVATRAITVVGCKCYVFAVEP